MVRMQDDECEKTAEFLRGAVEKVRALGRAGNTNNDADESTPEGMLTYLEMRRALLRLGFTWNKSFPRSNSGTLPIRQYYDDDNISIASETSKSSRVSGASGKVWGGTRKKRNVLSTDNQLIMLLSILVEMEERWRMERIENEDYDEEEDVCMRGLFLPELVQAYKLVIGGMQSLQSLKKDGANKTSTMDSSIMDQLSDRLRERTKGLLRSFGPDHVLSTRRNQSLLALSPYSKTKSGKSRDGLTPTKQQLFPSPTRTKTKAIADAAFAQPRLGEDSIRKLMHTKDATLAKIVEEHEVEMDAMVNNIEVLKEKEMESRSMLIKKRRTTRLLALVGIILILGVAGYWEHERRVWVQAQISKGREEERKKSLAEIERLTKQRDGLQKKLDTAEGTARYQHSRLVELESVTNRTLEEIASVEQKWWLEQAEMGRCQSAIKDVEGEIETLEESIEELSEERAWCSNRLKGRDAELNSLRYAKSDDGGYGDRGLALHGDGIIEHHGQGKPVKLEMKYNKSVRNAMILRQVYSGASGVAAGVVLRAIFPQAFSFLTLPAVNLTPAAKKAAVAVPKKKLVNVKWVDRIHAATVALLVVRTAVLFFMPLRDGLYFCERVCCVMCSLEAIMQYELDIVNCPT